MEIATEDASYLAALMDTDGRVYSTGDGPSCVLRTTRLEAAKFAQDTWGGGVIKQGGVHHCAPFRTAVLDWLAAIRPHVRRLVLRDEIDLVIYRNSGVV